MSELREDKTKMKSRQPPHKPLSFPPQNQGTMSVASDTSAETLESSLASYPPQHKHKDFDSEAKKRQGYVPHAPGS